MGFWICDLGLAGKQCVISANPKSQITNHKSQTSHALARGVVAAPGHGEEHAGAPVLLASAEPTPGAVSGHGGEPWSGLEEGRWHPTAGQEWGLVLLAVGIWMLERILPPPVTLALWALLLILSAIYLRALDQLFRFGIQG